MTADTSKPFAFKLLKSDGMARRGEITTPHGVVRTPAFMPVGTQATVKAMYPGQVRETGADVVLGNTYHLMLRPTAERVERLGGLHTFMNWPHTILTDSGGFQVMSLAQLRKLDEDGVRFQSHIDGKKYHLTPERSIEIQGLLGSDIQMQLDECIKLPSPEEEVQRAMELSLRWAERSRTQFETMGGPAKGQGLYGIVQGGDVPHLRIRSAEELGKMPFEGYSVGGLAVGEPQDVMLKMLEITTPVMPVDKPRYLMGVGTPDDLLESVARGIDQFDCVMPTRAGRHGLAYTRFGKVNLKNARHADDHRPLDEESSCPAASTYSRAYLHHLVRAGEGLAAMLLTWNNLAYYQNLMQGMRDAIDAGRLEEFRQTTKADWAKGDISPL
ncbi:tRNA guanosine(34) transglycosylase Tgt [Roseibium sp. RKSG952]|uniref:tRNA guanosine(34) transglycosylase Tgt n=1 Tax=Roseibium sp. RKSG952 TaxID=2529384 RepID=UPI0012BCE97A|nr:tRNA guanosine(34) transglycosylase Tgt [Roseibium sp. RKSG952]MTH97219.1 tRNA guanosine(34) transglycosylase Tgt [Roseibium sp. RKSG952]